MLKRAAWSVLVALACAVPAAAQTLDSVTYPFSFGSGAALEDMSSGTTLLIGPDQDNAVSSLIPIGFEFWFVGARQTTFSVNSNGLLRVGSSVITSAPTNNLASVLTAPQIAPYWDHLMVGTNGKVHSRVVGTSPNRKLVVEWQNMQVPRLGTSGPGGATFQCWLYETTGRIEFVFGAGLATNTIEGGASVGLGAASGEFASVTTQIPSISYGTANNANVTALASGARYTFTPLLPAAPTGLSFSQVSALGMTLAWADNASNEVGYAVWRSADAVNFEFVTQVAANSTSLAVSGLSPATTYQWIVRAVTEGAVSAPLTGSQATSTTGAIVTAGSGNWSSTTPGSPWPGGIVPSATDSVTIANGHTVTVDVAANCFGLTVGQGASGVLRFEPTTARTLNVVTGAVISPGGTLAGPVSGSQTGHVISLGGSLSNLGTLDLSTSSNAAGVSLTFTGASNTSLTGGGAMTDVRAITASKGTGAMLTLDAPNFTVRGVTADSVGFLTLSSGTFRLGGTFTMSSYVFTSAAYTLAAGTTFWLDNPNFVVLGQAGSGTVRGLRISAGSFRVGTLADHSLLLASGAQATVEGGEIRTTGRFGVSSSSNAITYAQTGGTVIVDTQGHTATVVAGFDLGTNNTSSVTISGGTIVLERASTAASGPRDYRNSAGLQSVTGGTLQLGDASSGAARTFYLSGTTPDLVVGNIPAGHTARLFGTTTVAGSTQIASGATLDLNGQRFTQSSGGLVNNGSLSGSLANSELYFAGTASPQSYSGTGSVPAPLSILSVDNPSGVTISASIAANLVTRRVNLIRGVLMNSQKLTLGNGSADTLSAVTQVGASGVTGAAGSYDVAPVFNPGVGGVSVSYEPEGSARTTGFEIPSNRQLRDLSVNRAGGSVAVSGGALSVSRGLTLSAGRLVTNASDLVTLGDTASVIPDGSSQAYVDGPLAIAVRTIGATPVSRTFSVGRAGEFRPLTLSSLLTGGVSQTFTAELLDGPTGGTPQSPLQSLTNARYWRVANSAGLVPAARVRLAFGVDDQVGAFANVRVAQSGTSNGTYNDLGGVATGSLSNGSVVSTADLTPGADYFVVASAGALAVTWDGGAGTPNWGDAGNWSPDGVPDSTVDVTLSLASPATINLAGTFAVRNLTVNSNVTLQLASGSLSVASDYSQSGGVVQLTSAAVTVGRYTSLLGGSLSLGSASFRSRDFTSITGGTLDLGSGTFTADSTFAIQGGTVSLGSGVLDLKYDFWRTSGNYFCGTGTTVFSGTTSQYVGGGMTHYNLVLRNGGAGLAKRFQDFVSHTVNNDMIVEGTAQMAVDGASTTQVTVWGNLQYSGIAGGTSIANLTLSLAGLNKVISGVPASSPALTAQTEDTPVGTFDVAVAESNFLTDPERAQKLTEEIDGKPLIVLENTYAKRKAQVEELLRTADPNKRLVINLDDMTIMRNPVSFEAFQNAAMTGSADATATTAFPMPVTVQVNANYSLDGNLTMGAARTLTVSGRLDAGTFTIGGSGGRFALSTLGTLATATTAATGLAGTVITTGTNTYTDAAIIEYNALGNQTLHAANHPAAAMMRTAGSGTKTLTANKSFTASSGALLSNGVLYVGPGTTFADGGFRLSFTTAQIANVIVLGSYLSTGSGSLSFETGATASNIQAVDGTVFGDLLMNFTASPSQVDLNTTGTSNLTFRNLTFGGTAGTANGGGTLRLSETGTTNVTVSGSVSISPRTVTNTGGGFGGTAGKTSQATLLGSLTTTSTATTQPIMNGTGTNRLVFAAASRPTLTIPVSATIFTGSILKLTGTAGLALAGTSRTYTIGAGGGIELGAGNIATGSTNTLSMTAGTTVTRTTGRVVGNLRKGVATGPVAATFEIGTETLDTPVSLAFGNVSVAGTLLATTTAGDHPNLGTSNLNATKSVNRYYTVTNTGVTFDTCAVGLTFPASEVDAGANTSAFALRKFNSPTWAPVVVASRTPTSIQGKRLTSFSDFAVGEATSYYLVASTTTQGTISPVGSLTVAAGGSQTYTLTPAAFSHVVDVVVDGFSVGPVASYSFTGVAADHTIDARFALDQYAIAASAGPNGSVSPAGSTLVTRGTSQAYTITPAAGYHVADVLVDGVSVGAVTSYNFTNVTAPHTISATFTVNLFTLTASAGANGAISPSGAVSAAFGSSQAFTITPALGYHVANVLVDGISAGAVTSYTFSSISANHTIVASFAIDMFTITASAGAHGSITPSGVVPVAYGDSLAFSILPDPGYVIADAIVDGVSVGPVTSYTFRNTTSSHTIAASFAFVHTITASAGANGTITPTGAVPVVAGRDTTFAITPAANFGVLDVLVDGVSVGAVTSYTFSNVSASHTIAASFTSSAMVAVGPAPTPISSAHPVVSIPVTLTRATTDPVRGYSVTFTLPPGLQLDNGLASITQGPFLSSLGTTVFEPQDMGGGTYTVDGVLLGAACGPTGSGTLFQIAVKSALAAATTSIAVDSVLLRNCDNAPLFVLAAPPSAIVVDNTLPVAGVTSPDGGEVWTIGTTHAITWTASDAAGVDSVRIEYSTDDGATWPYAVAAQVANSGTYSWVVPDTRSTTARVRVTAIDAAGNRASAASAAAFEIREVNVAPVLASIGEQTVAEGSVLAFTATATDANLPVQGRTFSLGAGAPATATIDAVSGAFSWTPGEAIGPGDVNLTVRVFDDGTPVLADSETIVVHVTEVNLAPVLAGVPPAASVPELAPYTFTATATDADLPPQTLTFSLVGAPSGASIGGSTGVFTWTPTEAQGPGVYPFSVRVSDGVTATDSTTTLTVTEANASPVLAGVPPTASIAELAPYTFTATATDADLPAQTLAFSLVGAPAGASIDGSTGVFSWTPTEAQGPGVYPFSVNVSDGVASSSSPINITVTEANAAPVLAGVPPTASVAELSPYTFTATATDADLPAQTLTFSLVGAPVGASIGGSTGAFSWTPTEAQGPGVYPFSVRVGDGITNTDAPISITVTEANVAPVLAGVPPTATVPELAPYTFTATATDADLPAQSLTFSLTGAPTGASIDGSTGAFSWTPTEAQGPGSYPFTVNVSDGVTSTSSPISIAVTEANASPLLAGVPPTASVAELSPYTFTATATDSDTPAQTLTFSLVGAPAGAAIDGSTGVFSWTPTEAQGPGVYPFSVRVSDGVANADAPISVTVTEANAAPVLAGVPPTASVLELAPYTFTATATDADLPAQTLTFSLVGAPAGASIGGSSGVFSWTPTEAQGPGVYPFSVRVSDGVANTDAPISVTVTETNTAPVLASVPPTASIAELAPYTFTATATDADLPAQTLTFSLTGAPAGASIGGSTGGFSWTPTEAQGPGTYPFTVNVSDGITSASSPISITVTEANVAPVLAGVPPTANVPELSPYTFTATATDADDPPQTLTFTLVGAPAGASIGSSSGMFSWTPSEVQGPGVYAFNVRASDGTANSDAPISITVTEVNVAPILAGVPPTASVPELAPYTFTATATDADLPAQTLTFSLAGAPAGASIDVNTGAFSWTPTEAQGPGSYPFSVSVSDGITSTSSPISITVTEANAAPVLAGVPPTATVPELAPYTFTATATDADLPAQVLTFSLVGAPSGASINGSSGAFSWTPTEAQGPGVYAFNVRVSDGVANTDAPISITVTEANAAPVLAAVPPTPTIPELAPYTFTATATDADLPAQTLTFSLVDAPAGASIGSSSGAFSWTPTEAQGPGSYPFTVRVSDGIANTDAPISITVTEANVAPVLAGVPPTATVPELAPYTFTATATDADLPAQALTFSLVGAPSGASIGSSTGAFSWTPTEAQGPGVYAFQVRASDGTANTDAPISVTVTEANAAPVLAGVPPTATLAELAPYTFTATATDADLPAQVLTFSLVGAPTGASIGSSTGAFTWTPTEAQGPGTYPFSVSVSDGVTSTSSPINLTVTEANLAPVLAGVPPTATVAELAPYTFTATATDADLPAQPLSFSLSGAPTGATIDGSTGAFSWTPTEAQGPGSYPFSVSVSDGFTSTSSPINITVTESNVAPVLAGVPPTATVPELAPYTFTATATDADLPAQGLTFSLTGGPAGAAIDGSTGVFSWTPTEGQGPGTYPFTVSVSDGVTSSSAPISITVIEGNTAPVLANVPATATVPELAPYTFTATATDSDTPAQTLTFSLVGAPAGAAIDGSTGAFSWTPTEAQGPGVYPFDVRVSDGFATASTPISITVTEVNAGPVLSGVPPTATTPELAPYTFTATATDADLPAQGLTFSLTGAPAGATIGSSSGVFSWTPTEAQGPGSYPFSVSVSDGVTSSSSPINITVTEVNAAPVLAGVPPTATIPELAPYTFTATATDADLPAQTRTFSLTGAPSGASIDGSTGVFSWTPTEAQGPGSYPFSVSVSDGITSTSSPISISVTEANAAPVLAGVPPTASVPELAPYTFTATATDSDTPAQTLTFSLTGAPAGASIGSSSGVFSWTPTEAQGPGSYPFSVSVSDGVTSTSSPINLTVTETNAAPVLAGVPPTATIPEQSAYTFTATATDSDLPAQTLAYSLVGAPAGASIGASSGAFSWTPTEAQGPGTYPFSVSVSDGVTSTSSPISITVTEANAAPVLASVPSTATVPELAPYTFTATATDSDLPAQTLAYSLVGAPAGASIGASSGAFSWTPTEAQGPGTYPFSVSVSDGVTSTSSPISVTVTEANVAPVLAGVPPTATIPELAPYTFTATATDSDLPAQTLTFSLVSAPTGASIDGSTGAFTWTPTEAQGPGTYPFSVSVSDGVTSTSSPINITVTEANAAPVLAGVPPAPTVPELAPYTFTATATDSDTPVQTLTFSLTGAPSGASIGGSSGVFTWTPTEAQGPGSYPFSVSVSDGVASSSSPISITVTEANAAPVLANVPTTATIPELAPYTFTATATDSDTPAQTLTFSLVGAPAGASIGNSTGAFSWTPTEAQGPGTYPFSVSVSDGVSNTTANISLTVTEANVAPVLAGVPPTASVPELAPYTFTATATDADLPAQPLTFSLSGAPAGATIGGSTGAFSWTPTEAQGPGSYPFSVNVSDGITSSSSPINITVTEANAAPVLAGVPPSPTVPELAPYTFTATATDADLPAQTLTYSLTGAPTGASIGGSTGVFSWTPTEAQGPGSYPFSVSVSDGVSSTSSPITITVTEANVAPVLAGVPPSPTVPELAPYTFTATATDSDTPAQTLSFSLTGAPSGASIGGSTGVFTWTPTEAQGPGSYPFSVVVSDGVTSTPSAISITVTEANAAPVLAGVPPTASIAELAPYTFTATATDGDLPAQTLTYSLVGAPAGASIGSSSGAFSWTPTEAQGPGNYPFSVSVSDGVTSTSLPISITVTEANVAPVLAGVPPTASVPELAPYTFTATATDSDTPAQTLTFSLAGAPAGATIGSSTGAFSWTPTEAQGPGTYPFSVSVSDGIANTTANISITVTEANVAPVLAGVPPTASVPELAPYTFTATATDSDTPAQTLTFSLVGAPAGASIGSSTGAFSWTPTEAQGPGSYPFSVSVSDGITSTSSPITITVTEANAAPVLAGVPPTATIPELAAYTFTATATDTDLPAQTLTFSLIGAPAGAAISGSTGVFSWTPTEAQGPGSYPFTVRVNDGIANSDAAITLTVSDVNAAPVLAGVPASATIPELSPYTFTATATDGDLPAQTLTFSLVGAPAGAGIGSSSGVFSWAPTEAQGPGSYPFTVRVSDGLVNSDAAITLTVSDVNAAPVLAGVPASATIPEVSPYTFTATATDSDLPAQALTFSLIGAPAGAGIGGSSGVFSWTPTEAQGPGAYPFTVRVSDGVVNSDAAITLTVSEVNLAPAISGVPATATLAELVPYTFTATASDADLPAQALTFSLVGAPAGASIGGSTGVFSWTPTEAQGPGTYPFTVRVSDGTLNADAAISLNVTEGNAAPVLSNVPATATIPELAAYTFTATATDSDTPAQTLTFSLVGAPAGASIGGSSGVFSWTPTEAQGPGAYPFTLRVSDGVVNTDAAVTLTVSEVNATPAVTGVPSAATIPELVAYTFTAAATDSDVPAQTVTFSLVGAPSGASIGASSGVFTWTPTEAQGPGTYPFSVRAGDGAGFTDVPVTLTVSEVTIAVISDLNAVRATSGNGADATARIALSWAATAPGTTVEVYRAPFTGYPLYDDAGGAAPSTPAYPPSGPWVLTTVTSPGQVDEPAARDFWYYVAFVRGQGLNVSAASNRTSGTLNYHLGDVSNGLAAGAGDNQVNVADLSLLGAHYGATGVGATPFAYLDVGPTTDFSLTARPTTDGSLDFEDLVVYALQFDVVSAPQAAARPDHGSAAAADQLRLDAPSHVAAGSPVTVSVWLTGSGRVHAAPLVLDWDPAVVRPVSASPGTFVSDLGGVLLSAAPGTADVALLGAAGVGFVGEGQLATFTFEVVAAGNPAVVLRPASGRDAQNRPVELSVARPAVQLPLQTALSLPAPNPFRDRAILELALARASRVNVEVFSVDGRRVRTIAEREFEPGVHNIAWDGHDEQGRIASAGVYFVRASADHLVFTRRVTLLK